MALNFNSRYPAPQSNAPDADYTYGSAKNVTTGSGTDGTPGEKDWLNDILGLLQRKLLEAGITPSGNPDNVQDSDYYDAEIAILLREMGSSSVRSFATVAAMVAATDLNVGDVVITEGYLAAGVGNALYQVVASGTGTADGGGFINLDSHQANLIPAPQVMASQYGAVGDGSTDDSTQIQALIDAFKNIKIDTNSKIDTKISVGSPRQIVIDNTIVAGAITAIFETGPSALRSIFEFTSNGTLVGDGATAGQVGINLDSSALVNVFSPVISGCLGVGIKINALGCLIRDAIIQGATGIAGISIINATSTGNKLTNCFCTGCANGILIESALYTRIENADCTANTGSGIKLQPSASGAGNGAKYTTIVAPRCTGNTGAVGSNAGIFVEEDCNFTDIIHPVCNDNTGDGIAVIGIASFESEHVKIQSPVCDNNTGSGVRSVRTKDIEINNGALINNTIDGIFDTISDGFKVFGGKLAGNTANGLRQQGSSNALHDGVTVSGNGGRGIWLNNTGSASDNLRTISCHFSGNTGADWEVIGATDAKAFRCTGDFVTEDVGTGLVDGFSFVNVGHGLSGVPERIHIYRTNNAPASGAMLYVSAITSTTFTVSAIDSAGAPVVVTTMLFDWDMKLFI